MWHYFHLFVSKQPMLGLSGVAKSLFNLSHMSLIDAQCPRMIGEKWKEREGGDIWVRSLSQMPPTAASCCHL